MRLRMSDMPGTRFNQSFYYLVSVRFFGSFAIQLQAVTLGWQMYRFTRDPLDLGLIGLAEAVPAISLALFAGYIVDRSNPKRVMLWVIFVSLTSILLSWYAKSPDDLLIAAFLTGCARSFYSPCFQSLTSRVVEKENINRAVALSTSAMKLAYMLGPVSAGFLIAWNGAETAYLVGSSLLFFALGFAFTLTYDHQPFRYVEKKSVAFIEDLLAGLKFVFKNKILLSALTLDMFAVLFGGVTALLPMISEEILHSGPTGLGFLRASPAIGAITTTLWLIRKPVNKGAGKLLLLVVTGFGVCILTFALSKNIYLSCVLLSLSGGLDSVSMVIRGSIVQLCSPESMRGRIAAVNSIFIGSSNEIGAFESGVAARLLGLAPSILFGGIMTLLTVALIAHLVPELRKLDLDSL